MLILFQNKQFLMEISTVKSPNPEEPEALTMALALAENQCRYVVGTDPDCDRLGVAVRV
jgi:phosphomannomutase